MTKDQGQTLMGNSLENVHRKTSVFSAYFVQHFPFDFFNHYLQHSQMPDFYEYKSLVAATEQEKSLVYPQSVTPSPPSPFHSFTRSPAHVPAHFASPLPRGYIDG